MVARRSGLALVVSACVFACVLFIGGAAPAFAGSFQFGSYGSEAEQLKHPAGVAVDAAGDVYVGDLENNRVDRWDGAGDWLLAWGVGVFNEASEMQTCTTVCERGQQSGAQEAFELPTGVAVDTDPLSASYGDVYVVDRSHRRVEKFEPHQEAGGKVVMRFVLMFGGHVNEETSAANPDVCLAGEKCKLAGTLGTSNGEFGGWPFASFIAVGPDGSVYVGDKARVQVFEPSGVWKENISLSGLSATGRPTALAVDSSGNVFLKDMNVAGVREFVRSGGVWGESATQFDAASTTVTSLAADPSGDVYVGDSEGGFHVLEYEPSGKELASFGAFTVKGPNMGLAFSSATGELYASEAEEYPQRQASVWVLSVPAPGPVIESETATPEVRGAAMLEAQVDPEGRATSVHFEYVDDEQFKASGFASAASTTPTAVGSTGSFGDQPVSASLPQGTLVPGTFYHWRAVASDECKSGQTCTTTGEQESFQETPPALIEAPWVSDVAGTSATIGVRINPLGADTTYRLEYGTSTAYGHVFTGSAGESNEYVTITRHLQQLEPVTTYHYRIVTNNEVGTWQSADGTFTTQAATGELVLPDGRAWELVSPPNKHGALIGPPYGLDTEAASDGSGIVYGANEPITEKPPASAFFLTTVLSGHGAHGWTSKELGGVVPLSSEEGGSVTKLSQGVFPLPLTFSSDLSAVLIEPYREDTTRYSSEATERALYLYDNATGGYRPLVTPANVPSGTKFGGTVEYIPGVGWPTNQLEFIAATPDLAHVVFQSPFKLTPEALEGECHGNGAGTFWSCAENLYEWSDGRLSLINVLPDGRAMQPVPGETTMPALGRGDVDMVHAISNDGRRIVWSDSQFGDGRHTSTYARDLVEGKTLAVGGEGARFETMSADGSRVFYWENQDLYVLNFDTETVSDISANHTPGEHFGGVKDGFVMEGSEDGSYIYYVATGALAPGAVDGEDNLYVSHYNGGAWRTTLVATLSKEDEFQTGEPPFLWWFRMDVRVSPNGRYLAFLSSRPLTGYDNTDASSGQRDEEAYLYDALPGRLVCVSCDPTGARPTGMQNQSGSLVDPNGDWVGHWVAATLPEWATTKDAASRTPPPAQDQPRYLSDSGRLFFNGSDALVPQDTNGQWDVYQYEPAGVGGCTSASTTFNERSGGCVDLLSAGTSGVESGFVDASENGNDGFFVTDEKLVGEDYDTGPDVYDAHVCGSGWPCVAAVVSPPACTSDDSCKAAPSPQPELFGPAPSATFNGQGNVLPSKPVVRSRSLTRAQKLARSLRLCRKKNGRSRRRLCERRARERYRALGRSRKAKAMRKGSG